MTQKISPKLLTLVFSVLVLCFLATLYIFAWTEPLAPPPWANVAAPINVSSSEQWKLGEIGLGFSVAPYDIPAGAMAATAFYDSDSSSYYVNPATESVLRGRVDITAVPLGSPPPALRVAGSLVTTAFDDVATSQTGMEIGYRTSYGRIRVISFAGEPPTAAPLDIQATAVRIMPPLTGVYATIPDRPFYVVGSTPVRHTATFESEPDASDISAGIAIGEITEADGTRYRSIQSYDRNVSTGAASWTNLAINRYGGNVGIGDSDPTYKLELPNTAGVGGQGRANSWVTYSSIRWKDNITPIEGALDKVSQLRGVRFNWKDSGVLDIGMVAEEVGKVVPEVVNYEKDGVYAESLDYGRLVPLLIEAIKEQQKQIDELKGCLGK